MSKREILAGCVLIFICVGAFSIITQLKKMHPKPKPELVVYSVKPEIRPGDDDGNYQLYKKLADYAYQLNLYQLLSKSQDKLIKALYQRIKAIEEHDSLMTERAFQNQRMVDALLKSIPNKKFSDPGIIEDVPNMVIPVDTVILQ